MRRFRACAFNAAFLAWTIVLGIVGLAVRAVARHRALDLARLWVRGTVRLLDRVGGVSILVSGREHLGQSGALVAAEHRAAIDSLVWLALVRRPSYVMKQELRRIPLVGALLEPAGMIPIDRAGGAPALRAMLRAGRAAMASGRTLVIFPEGTRVACTGDAALQGGIVALSGHGAIPVVPVSTDSGRAWGTGFLLRTDKAAGRGPVAIRIAIGPPIGRGIRDPRPSIEAAWRAGDDRIASGAGLWTSL